MMTELFLFFCELILSVKYETLLTLVLRNLSTSGQFLVIGHDGAKYRCNWVSKCFANA